MHPYGERRYKVGKSDRRENVNIMCVDFSILRPGTDTDGWVAGITNIGMALAPSHGSAHSDTHI